MATSTFRHSSGYASCNSPRSNRTDRLRHDRGSAHIPGRTSLAHPNCRGTDLRADSCDCRGRRERNSACDRITGRGGSRGGRGLVSCAVLQQADAGGALRSFPVARGIDGAPLSFMTCRREQHVVFQIIRSRGWRSCRASLGSRMRRASDAAGTPSTAGRDEFRLLCGDDALALPYFAQGGDGCISVTSNVAPGLCRNMFLAWKQGHSVAHSVWRVHCRADGGAVPRDQSCSAQASSSAARSHVVGRSFADGRIE